MKYHLKLCTMSNQVIHRLGPFDTYEELYQFYSSGIVQGRLVYGEDDYHPTLVVGDLDIRHSVAMVTMEFQDGTHSIPTFVYHPDLGGLLDWSKITG